MSGAIRRKREKIESSKLTHPDARTSSTPIRRTPVTCSTVETTMWLLHFHHIVPLVSSAECFFGSTLNHTRVVHIIPRLPNVTIHATNANNSTSGSPQPSGAPKQHSESNTGPIVGGVVVVTGGSVLLLVLGIFLWRRSHRSRRDEKVDILKSSEDGHIIPYHVSNHDHSPWLEPTPKVVH